MWHGRGSLCWVVVGSEAKGKGKGKVKDNKGQKGGGVQQSLAVCYLV